MFLSPRAAIPGCRGESTPARKRALARPRSLTLRERIRATLDARNRAVLNAQEPTVPASIDKRGRRWDYTHYPSVTNQRWVFNVDEPERQDGWLDVRWFDDRAIAQGAGVSGGSLTYANVSVPPPPSTFESAWPEPINANDVARNRESSMCVNRKLHTSCVVGPVARRTLLTTSTTEEQDSNARMGDEWNSTGLPYLEI